ncbi:AAEL003843-PA [Aedes aegypti]|uniref:AAEL003843-PA n=1 Tax=Aedes aegypti TaxID=7159 RepID=Q17EE0_AEDAE|nr:AAEL003843-PA [Aedes aegypti]
MQFTIVFSLALLCFASMVSAQSQDSSAEREDLDQYEVGYKGLNLVKVDLPQLRNRCKSMGNCVHDRLCDSSCKQFGYKDGECSGRSCICCA